jgi:hypothetical protein
MNTTHPVLKTVTEVEGSLRDSRSRGDCRTRRCSNGVLTPSSKTLILSWLGRRRVWQVGCANPSTSIYATASWSRIVVSPVL